jgi:hypothetical protein
MNFTRISYKVILMLIPILSFVMHFHVLNRDLVGIHVWRQTETQTVINNFARYDMDITHPMYNDIQEQNVKMEFPLMQWAFAMFYRAFGDYIAISRILSFIIGICSVLGMFYLCDAVFRNKWMAAICAWCFNWSPVFFYYTVNPLPDNFALCCAIWSAVFFFRFTKSYSSKHAVASAIFAGLATLTKLPFILYSSLVFAFLIIVFRSKENKQKGAMKIVWLYALAHIPAILWYRVAIPTWGDNGVIKGMFNVTGSRSEILNILVGNLTSILPELIINYGSVLFFITGFYFLFRNNLHKRKHFLIFLLWSLSILAYFLFEANMIGLVHDYYLFPFLPMIFLLVAYGAWHMLNTRKQAVRYFALLLLAVLPVTAFLRINSRWDTENPGFNPVYYKYKNELQALIPKKATCIVGNDDSRCIVLYYLNRRGFSFSYDMLTAKDIEMLNRKAVGQYLFTDSPVDSNAAVKQYLEAKIFEKENLRVYKIKNIYQSY